MSFFSVAVEGNHYARNCALDDSTPKESAIDRRIAASFASRRGAAGFSLQNINKKEGGRLSVFEWACARLHCGSTNR